MSAPITESPVASITARRLSPAEFTLQTGAHEQMECSLVATGELYKGVSAVLLFPISHPQHYVSLRYVDADDKEKEIGLVESLKELDATQQQMIHASLVKQYHEQVVLRIVKIKQEFGQLFFTVVTQRGTEQFVMPWRQDRAEDWGASGKVLLDSLNNRYLVPDVDKLSPTEKRTFKTHVYW